jgi:voltage-gated potassium channel
MKIKELKKRIHTIMEPGETPSRHAKMLSVFIITVILINCISMILESIGGIYQRMPRLFDIIEIVSVLIFTVEYALRLWCFSASETYKPWSRLKYIRRPMMVIDLLAILPFYVASIGLDLRSIRILRIFRVFRILKLGNYSKSVQILLKVIRHRKEDLAITVIISLVLMFISSVIVYFAEHDTQPDTFSSIVSALWWAVATLTPGPPAYQFAQPITTIGKMAGGAIQLIGIAIIALPTGILGAGFNEELIKHKQAQEEACKEPEEADAPGVNRSMAETLSDISSRLESIERKLDALNPQSKK